MEKITFVNENAPYVSAENLNQMQENVESAINGVVESGSNDNGYWIKYADGTMICTGSKSVIANASTTNETGGGIYRSSGIEFNTFPQSFTDVPYSISYGIKRCTKQDVPKFILENFNDSYAVTNSSPGKIFIGFLGTTDLSLSIDATVTYIAIGRWK